MSDLASTSEKDGGLLPFSAPVPGHWDTPEGIAKANEYVALAREDLGMGHLTDYQLANAQYLVGRHDLDLLAFQTAAKERIRWLSAQLARALASPAPAESGEAVGYVTQAAIDLMLEAKPGSSGYHLIFSTPHAKSLPKQQSADVPIYLHPPAESAGSTSGVGVTIADEELFSWFDTLNSCLETFWAITQPDTDNRLLAEGALDALQALQATTLSAAPSDPSRDTQPAKEGGNG